mmetsp:Transcript_71100/g.205869  ORF Transcript_71100/g.205869 Transcript_71100/m.205869 type:complete len:230 (-) Transcript_71100:574-1263(-)
MRMSSWRTPTARCGSRGLFARTRRRWPGETLLFTCRTPLRRTPCWRRTVPFEMRWTSLCVSSCGSATSTARTGRSASWRPHWPLSSTDHGRSRAACRPWSMASESWTRSARSSAATRPSRGKSVLSASSSSSRTSASPARPRWPRSRPSRQFQRLAERGPHRHPPPPRPTLVGPRRCRQVGRTRQLRHPRWPAMALQPRRPTPRLTSSKSGGARRRTNSGRISWSRRPR